MTSFDSRDYGVALLRVSLGVMLIAHSLYLKLVVFTLPGTAAFMETLGLPGFSGYLLFFVEAAAGVGLLLGLHTRLMALAAVPILAGATWVHSGNGWLFSNPQGGWEYPLFLTAAAAAQTLLGDGAWALGRTAQLTSNQSMALRP